MRIKKRKKELLTIESLVNYQNHLEEISSLSASVNGTILVNSSRKMINLDTVVKNLKLEVKSTDAIHYNSLKNTLYIIEFKNSSILDDGVSRICNLNTSCVINSKSKKSKNKEIRANLILKGIDTYLIVLKKILTDKEYSLILDKKIKIVYIIVNSLPTQNQNSNNRKKNRLLMLTHLDSIHSKIPDIFKRYEKEIFDQVIFESDSFFKRELLPKIY